MKKDITQIYFPNGKAYLLYPEEKTIHKYGLDFPTEVSRRTLFVTGISGSGKTNLVSRICEKEHMQYKGQVSVLLNEKPKIIFCDYSKMRQKLRQKRLSKFSGLKVVDGHFIFEIPAVKKRSLYAHSKEVCRADYDALNLLDNLLLERQLKKKFIFEFRQLSPFLIQEARKKREAEESAENLSPWLKHTFRQHTEDEILKGEYLLYQAAHNLFENGLDVYIRTRFDGEPLRFLR